MEEDRIIDAIGRLSDLPVFIDDTPYQGMVEMRSKARRLALERGLDLLVVDYLQLVQGKQKWGQSNRVQEITEISRELKVLAGDLKVALIACSQLNRMVENRPNNRPRLSDLRDSGSIEQDADVVMFIHREDVYTTEEEWTQTHLGQDYPRNIAEIIMARRTMAVANSDASSLLGGWSFRKDNLSRSLSHFVSLWDGDPTSIDRRNPESPEIFFYQRRLTALIMGQVNVVEDLLFSQAAGNGFTARCLPSMDRERPKPPADTSTTHQAALDTIADMRELVIRRRADQDANAELLQGVLRRPVIHPEHNARDLLAAASAKFDTLADATDNLHERGFWARAQEQTARYAATLAYVRTLEEGIPQSWEHVHYTRPEVDQAEAVITWHGDLIRPYAVQAASEKVTRLANETITMLREKREKVVKEDGSIAARNIIARLGKGQLRTDAALREQVLDVLVVHRHLIPTARRGHYMMVVPCQGRSKTVPLNATL